MRGRIGSMLPYVLNLVDVSCGWPLIAFLYIFVFRDRSLFLKTKTKTKKRTVCCCISLNCRHSPIHHLQFATFTRSGEPRDIASNAMIHIQMISCFSVREPDATLSPLAIQFECVQISVFC